MIKHGFEGCLAGKDINDFLPQLIEYYVKFYGEKHRQQITDRLNHTIFVFAENQSEKYAEEIEKRFSSLIEQDAENGGENIEYLENEKEKVLDMFMETRPRRYRRELENYCLRYVTYYIKEIFGFADNQISEVKELAKQYLPFLKLGRTIFFKIYENNEEKQQFNELVSNIAKLKGFKSKEEYSDQFKTGVKHLSSVKKANAVKGQLKDFINLYNKKMFLTVNDVVQDIIRSGVLYSDEIIEEIERYITTMEGLIALTTVSINTNKPDCPICVCCVNEPVMLDDQSLIHELNHAITSYASFKNDFFVAKSGITECTYYVFNQKNIKSVEGGERYEALDEIINDYLSKKVYRIAEEDGFSFGGGEKIESLYSAAFPMFEDFIEEHLSEIKEIVLNEDGKALENYLGLKNVIKLADLATEMLDYCNKNKCDKEYREMVGLIGGEKEVDFFSLAKRKDELIFSPYKKYLALYGKGERVFKEVNASLNKREKYEKPTEKKVKNKIISSSNEGRNGEQDETRA